MTSGRTSRSSRRPGFEAATGAAVARVTCAGLCGSDSCPAASEPIRLRPARSVAFFVCACGADRSTRGGAEPAARLAGGRRVPPRVAQRTGAPGLRVTAHQSSPPDGATGARDQARRHLAVLLHGQFAAARHERCSAGASTRSAPMRSTASPLISPPERPLAGRLRVDKRRARREFFVMPRQIRMRDCAN